MARQEMKLDAETVSVGTEAWNVADGYVKMKILKQLILCDRFEMIAIYGTEDIDDELQIPQEMLPFRRVNSINRLKDNLKQLFGNVEFAIRKEDEDKFDTLRKRITLVESMLNDISYMSENQVSKAVQLRINEEFFMYLLNELQEIKNSLNIPINNAGLIFRSNEEVSFDDLLDDIAKGG